MDRPLIKFYSAVDIRAILKMDQAIDEMRDAIQDLAAAQPI